MSHAMMLNVTKHATFVFVFFNQETIDKLDPLPSILNQITESLGPQVPRIVVSRCVEGFLYSSPVETCL